MSAPPPAPPEVPAANPAPRTATLPEVVGTVFASFLGIRKGAAMRKDAVTVKPHQVILVGLVLAAVFVLTLIFAVRLIIRAAGA